jgi:topoisomerase IV subunit B
VIEAEEGRKAPRANRHRVRAWPDPQVLRHPKIRGNDWKSLLRAKAVLLPGLRVACARRGEDEREWLYAEGGLSAYLNEKIDGWRRLREPDLRRRVATPAPR